MPRRDKHPGCGGKLRSIITRQKDDSSVLYIVCGRCGKVKPIYKKRKTVGTLLARLGVS